MPALTVLAALAFATATTPSAAANAQNIATRDVAFEDLADGREAKAIARLQAGLRQNPGDPAILINLGTAYARQGDRENAARSFRAARDSSVRYRLELADGSWADSREAARRALAGIGVYETLASR